MSLNLSDEILNQIHQRVVNSADLLFSEIPQLPDDVQEDFAVACQKEIDKIREYKTNEKCEKLPITIEELDIFFIKLNKIPHMGKTSSVNKEKHKKLKDNSTGKQNLIKTTNQTTKKELNDSNSRNSLTNEAALNVSDFNNQDYVQIIEKTNATVKNLEKTIRNIPEMLENLQRSNDKLKQTIANITKRMPKSKPPVESMNIDSSLSEGLEYLAKVSEDILFLKENQQIYKDNLMEEVSFPESSIIEDLLHKMLFQN